MLAIYSPSCFTVGGGLLGCKLILKKEGISVCFCVCVCGGGQTELVSEAVTTPPQSFLSQICRNLSAVQWDERLPSSYCLHLVWLSLHLSNIKDLSFLHTCIVAKQKCPFSS